MRIFDMQTLVNLNKDKTYITENITPFTCFHVKTGPKSTQDKHQIQTRIIYRSSLPAKHADDNTHKLYWSQTKFLGQAITKHTREFKEAWLSMDKLTFNRHTDIPAIYLQL